MTGRPNRRAPVVLVTMLGVVAMLSTALAFAATKPRIWLDRPLPGAVLVFGPTTVTVHAASAGGIAVVRFSVDGSPAQEVGAPGGDLVTVEWTWTPTTPGEHVVTAFARGVDGVFSDPVAASVTFVGRDELPPSAPPSASSAPLPTPVFSATPAPTRPGASAGPSATPGPSAAPTLTPGPSVPPTPGPTRSPSPEPSLSSIEPSPDPSLPSEEPSLPPSEEPCLVPTPTALVPAFDTVYTESVSPIYEWSLSGGDPSCVVEIVLWLNVRDGHSDFPSPWLYEHHLQPHETFYQWPDYVLVPDPEANPGTGCGIYWWWVEVVGPEYNEQSAQSSIYVCPPP